MATAAPRITEAEQAFLGSAVAAAREPAWLAERRTAALGVFAHEGLPDRRVEAFHFTDVKALLREAYPPSAEEAARPPDEAALAALAVRLEAHIVPIVNGRALTAKSAGAALPAGVAVLSVSDAVRSTPDLVRGLFAEEMEGRENALATLNLGLARDGAAIRVNKGVSPPLIVLHHASEMGVRQSLHVRHLVSVEAGAAASVIEIFESPNASQHLLTEETRIELGEGAKLFHAKLVLDGESAVHLARAQLQLAAGADYRAFLLGAGARLARHEALVAFAGEGAHASLSAALLLSGEQHFDFTSRIDHAVPNCESETVARAVVTDHARGVVQGAVRVAPDAQHSDARQLIRGLLLSDRAELDSKPELEILADDVKCSHGAASGDLDEDAVFYLRSRGIPEAEARALLIEAFLEESFGAIDHLPLRALAREKARGWLDGGKEVGNG